MGKTAFRFDLKKRNNDSLVVFFTSYKDKPSREKLFDWWGYRDFYKNRLFIEDETNTWYHGCYGELRSFLRFIPKRTLMVGISAGAYIALIMAKEFDCHSMALNPQTCLFNYDRIPHKAGWRGKYDEIKGFTKFPELLDVSWISGNKQNIYYSVESPTDRFHAERMNVNLHPCECGVHGLGKWMKENGTLDLALDERINELGGTYASRNQTG